ncbi:TetR/AcrR family transcriptional regulator [Microbacterium sp. 22195]|uniref:TetR/AcrR family transcriptional regulator n=1 Tax=Microbacterium sp. 22195 TaxID=3453891 RepID=UPI003F87761C
MSRESMLDHVVDVIAADGMAGLSIRTVAARAGVAIGTVQHWFPTKQAMLLAAMDRTAQIAAEASAARLSLTDPADRVRAVAELLVPADPSSPVSRVWIAFAAHAVADAEVRARYEQLWARTHAGVVGLLASAAPSAAASALDDAAGELLALADGLTIAVLDEPGRMPPARAGALIRRRVDAILAELGG